MRTVFFGKDTQIMPVAELLESHMAYAEAGDDDAVVVFLHGNPTSSYLWRNVIPHVAGQARCLPASAVAMAPGGPAGW
jgi:haloalkane dehalogenase